MDDAALRALLAEDGLAERDPVFTLAVMQGVARKRLVGELLDVAVVVFTGAVLLWMLVPSIELALRGVDLALLAPAAIGLLVTVSVLIPLGLANIPPVLRRMTET